MEIDSTQTITTMKSTATEPILAMGCRETSV